MIRSQRFAGNDVFERVAADTNRERISRTTNNIHAIVTPIQEALEDRSPGCLPVYGIDGDYGSETATAVRQLKIEEFPDLLPPIYDDVGPRTMLFLDDLSYRLENPDPVPTAVFIRQDAWKIDPDETTWNPIMEAYARAVGMMKTLPVSDTRSWAYQAAVHGTYSQVMSATWNSCQHGNWFFLPWHRMYLYYFESVVRSIVKNFGGPEDFAIPYWNYENPFPANQLPYAFRRPTLSDGTPNPLLVPEPGRGRGFNTGATRIAPITSSARALAEPRFVLAAPAAGFGGGAMRVSHNASVGSFGLLESSPHNGVHNAVGEQGAANCSAGLMIDGNCAALDPIFWLHHANVDRLWNVWLSRHGGSNPSDNLWLDQTFRFAVEDGSESAVAVRDFRDSRNDLHYVYDDIPDFQMPADLLVQERGGSMQLIAATSQPLAIGNAPAEISLSIPPNGLDLFQRFISGAAELFLSVEDIQADENPGVGYAVRLGSVDSLSGGVQEWLDVGLVTLFGLELSNDPDQAHSGPPGLQHTFNISAITQSLVASNRIDPTAVAVSIEPVDLVETDDPSMLRTLEQLPLVTIGRISLFVG